MTDAREANERGTSSAGGASLYTSLDTPLGPIVLVASSRGLSRVWFGEAKALLAELESAGQALPQPGEAALSEVRTQFEHYFDGEPLQFDLALDLSVGSAFQQQVWHATAAIPYGKLETYGGIARSMGMPQAVRAVGHALGQNPVPVIVPCHRVLAANNQLGGFSLGLPLKRALLRLEGHAWPEPLGGEQPLLF